MRHPTLLLLSFVLTACPGPESPPWQLVASDLPSALMSIDGSSAEDVWAVGADHGRGPLVLHYDGEGWTSLDAGVRQVDFWWVESLGPGAAYMGGGRGAIVHYEAGTFTRMATPGYANEVVFGIWARSADDAWAVGAIAGRSGFVWHYDGAAWSRLSLPRDLPLDAEGEVPGLFKVWGDEDEVWVVGNAGTILRSTDGETFSVVPSGTTDRLFTLDGAGDVLIAVGGGAAGRVIERGSDGTFGDRTPAFAPLIQGISCRGGAAWASGFGGAMWERQAGGWAEVDHGLFLDVASLHATWIDPDGGVWAVGGGVLSPALDGGAIIHRGPTVPTYDPAPPPVDAGPDGMAPVPVCPEAAIDPEPEASIARRWNEQILNAIRRDIPRPGIHARNLFHLSVAMWDAWAAYDATADGYLVRERLSASDVAAAREEAISYAAYRVLEHRYDPRLSTGGAVSEVCFREFMNVLGYDPDDTIATGDSPRALGNRIGAAVVAMTIEDGSNEANNYADTTGWMPTNPPLYVDQPAISIVDPDIWQQLDLAVSIAQNGIPLGGGAQPYIGANWGLVRPFALTRASASDSYFPGERPPVSGEPGLAEDVVEVIRRSAELDPALPATIDTSPASTGNNPLGTNDGTGYDVNPATSGPYAPHVVPLGDFGRVLAEFWADGPRSETPPGHWNTLANYVADDPDHVRLWEGTGTELDPLEWDVRTYFAINGAVHDAAIAAWELKRRYTSSRPITLIRYMASLGQSSDPSGPSYDAGGLPLVPDLIEVVTEASAAPGERHAHLAAHVGEIAIRSWLGEPGDRRTMVGGSGWIRGVLWMPYQLRTFVTPAFPGFVSGHSTFSRAAAEVLTRINGTPYFPGGLGEFVAAPGMYSTFELGPSTEVRLQWATYYDAADQAGQSRIWGGIHISADDFGGRRIGSVIGLDAYDLASTYFDGSAVP